MLVASIRSGLGFGLLLGVGVSFAAGDTFVGTWVERIESYRSSPIDTRSFHIDGQKINQTTVLSRPQTYSADGVARPLGDGAVEIATLHGISVFVRRIERDGKPVSQVRWEVSPDDRTVTSTTTYYTLTGEQTQWHVFDRKSGTGGLNGTWEPRAVVERSKPETVVIGLSEEGLVITRGWGRSWIVDGRPRTIKDGDGSTGTVTVRQIGPRSIERTTVKDDKITFRTSMELAADGKAITQTDQFKSTTGVEITAVSIYAKQ